MIIQRAGYNLKGYHLASQELLVELHFAGVSYSLRLLLTTKYTSKSQTVKTEALPTSYTAQDNHQQLSQTRSETPFRGL